MNREEREIEFLTQYFGEDFREMTKEKYEENLKRFPYATLVIEEDAEEVEGEVEENSGIAGLLIEAINHREERVSIGQLMAKHILPTVVRAELTHEDLKRDVIVSDILELSNRIGIESAVRYYNRTRMTDEEIAEQEQELEDKRIEQEKATESVLSGLGAVEVEEPTVVDNWRDESLYDDEDDEDDEDEY